MTELYILYQIIYIIYPKHTPIPYYLLYCKPVKCCYIANNLVNQFRQCDNRYNKNYD